MTARARRAIAEGRQIIIFPEGTRRPPLAAPEYRHGVMRLYRELDVPCLPVALNSGLFWPRRQWVRRPGVVVIEFLEPIPPLLERDAFMSLLQDRIETASDRLIAEAGGLRS
jgi:1-acyl-sn-glycerol-3-phosphate acyltransferase